MNGIEKSPSPLVELFKLRVGTPSAGLKPATITGSFGFVTSSMVIQVALPKPVISLVPLMVRTHPRTVGCPGVVPGVSARHRDCIPQDERRQVDGKLALAVACRHERVGIGRRRSVRLTAFGAYGPSRVGIPVMDPMSPSERLSEVTAICGR